MILPEWIEPNVSILPPAQRRLWPELIALPRPFVLYGGTGLALRLGGRESEDFDFFSADAVEAHQLSDALGFLGKAELIQAAPNTATFLLDRQGAVKVSFFGGLTCGRVGEPGTTRDTRLQVASLLDLAAHKVRTIQVRAASKDYLDIHTLLVHGVSLARALGAARGLFPDFSTIVSLKALSYFGDGDLPDLPEDIKAALAHSAETVQEIVPVPRVARDLWGA